MYKFETIETSYFNDDDELLTKLNDFYKDGWEVVNFEKFNKSKYEYNNGSQIIERYYIKFLLKRIKA